jgi:hypothetical protein
MKRPRKHQGVPLDSTTAFFRGEFPRSTANQSSVGLLQGMLFLRVLLGNHHFFCFIIHLLLRWIMVIIR